MPDGAGSDRAHCSDPHGPRDVGGTLCCEWESGRSGQSRGSVGCVHPQQLCCPLGAAGRPHTLPAVLFPSGWHTKLSTSEKNYLEKHRVVGNAANTKGISSPGVRQSSAASRAQHHSKTKLLLELRWALNLQIHITILYIYIYTYIFPAFIFMPSSQLRQCRPRRTWSHPDRGGFSPSARPQCCTMSAPPAPLLPGVQCPAHPPLHDNERKNFQAAALGAAAPRSLWGLNIV